MNANSWMIRSRIQVPIQLVVEAVAISFDSTKAYTKVTKDAKMATLI